MKREHQPVFDYLKQLYLLQSQTLLSLVDKTDGVSEHSKRKSNTLYVNLLMHCRLLTLPA